MNCKSGSEEQPHDGARCNLPGAGPRPKLGGLGFRVAVKEPNSSCHNWYMYVYSKLIWHGSTKEPCEL